MIRRQVGAEYWLIAQHDHAMLSGQLARQLGRGFSAPTSDAAALGISLHDCGWPLHDDQPVLNARHQPIDVFETTRDIGLPIWEASADRAAAQEDYAGLLVSLHSLALSIFVSEQAPISGTPWDLADARTRFEINRFQHRMIELQECLRARLGMRTDRPLKHGLAVDAHDAMEQRLVFDFRLLQAMDKLSLCICCTNSPFETIAPILRRPEELPTAIKVCREEQALLLSPWPFEAGEMEADVPFRRLEARAYESDAEYRSALAAAPVERFTAVLRPLTI